MIVNIQGNTIDARKIEAVSKITTEAKSHMSTYTFKICLSTYFYYIKCDNKNNCTTMRDTLVKYWIDSLNPLIDKIPSSVEDIIFINS